MAKPAKVKPAPQTSALTRATARDLNRVDVAPYLNVARTGLGKVLPVIYGEVRTSGLFLTRRVINGAGNLVFAVAWSHGPVEGVQATYINGQPVPDGVAVRHYKGEAGQPVDPTLAAAIPGFGDDFPNVAYSVFEVTPTAAVDGLPRPEVVIRGRLVLDPRTGVTAWSATPALFIHDFVTSTRYGPGLEVLRGLAEVADRNDSLYLDEPRCRAGLMIAQPDILENILPILCDYAECLWAYDAGGIILVPDAAVSEPAQELTDADIIEGSLRPVANGSGNTPTVMVVNYMKRTNDHTPWVQTPVVQIQPEATFGDTPEIESSVNMLGVYRELEAARRAVNRLNRLRYPGTVAWRAFDAGIRFQKGDVVRLPNTNGFVDQWVRVMDVQMYEPGRYQINAEVYEDSIYADEIVSDYPDSPVYEGLILPYSGTLPSGWEDYTAANGYYIKGASTTIDPGDITGTAAAPAWSGFTSTDDIHQPPGAGNSFNSPDGASVPLPGGVALDFQAVEVLHNHAVTIPSHVPNVYRRATKLMKKTSGNADFIPLNASILGESGILAFGLFQIVAHNSRILMADDENYSAGNASPVLSGIGTSAQFTGTHSHISDTGAGINYQGPDQSGKHAADPAGRHSHPNTTPVVIDPARTTACLYGVSYSNVRIKRGMVAFWDGPVGSLPADWYLCDGTNGTMNFANRLIELSGGAGQLRGDNTIKVQGKIGPGWHDHSGSNTTAEEAMGGYSHGITFHDHDIDAVISWNPESFHLAVIQYLPEAIS